MRLTFYMKSGNSFTVGGIKDYNIRYRGNEVVALELTYRRFFKPRKTILMGALDLSQIESIVKER